MGNKKVQLLDNQIAKLMTWPETGMGYQLVDLVMRDGSIVRNRVVFNSELLALEPGEVISPEEISDLRISDSPRITG